MKALSLLLVLAAASWADLPAEQKLPAQAVQDAQWIKACAKDDPFEGKPFAGGLESASNAAERSEKWFAACFKQTDPCWAVSLADAEKEKVPRCTMCQHPPSSGCGVDRSCLEPVSCAAPIARFTLEAPPLLAAPTGPPGMETTTEGCIARLLKDDTIRSKRTKECRASDKAIYERNKGSPSDFCEASVLRNADHYLFMYCGYQESFSFNGFPVTWCGLSYGYSGVKKLLGGFRSVLNTGSSNASEPSWEEGYWGCRGIRDAQKADP